MTSDIQITRSGQEPGAASFKIEVPPERVEAAEHKAAKAFAKRARLPGFRKGKAPLAVIKKRYHEAIREQVLHEVIGESWKATIAQEDLKPIADPRVHDVKFERGAPLTFQFHVELKPELTLERLGGFTVVRAVPSVTDEMVEAQLDDLRRQRSTWVPIEDRSPKPGELVRGSVATIESGTPGESKDFQITLGEGQAIPDIEEKLMTLAPGDTVDTTVRFPDDFPEETKRGRSRDVRIVLHEAKFQDLPALDDGFAREVGDFETLIDLRKTVREDLELEARREADGGVRRQLLEQIVAANNVPAPRPLVERFLQAYDKAYDVPADRGEAFRTEFRPIAEAQVRRDLIMEQIATQEDLHATEEELDEHIAEIAKRRSEQPGEIYTRLQKANRLREIEHGITENKVFDFLLQQSTVTES